MDQKQKQSLHETKDSLDSGKQGNNSDQRVEATDSISDLNKRLESSLNINEKHDTKPTQEMSNKQRDITKPKPFQKRSRKLSSEQSSKEIPCSSYESLSRSAQTPGSKKTDNVEQSSRITKTADSRKNTGMQKYSPYSGRSYKLKSSYSCTNIQCVSKESISDLNKRLESSLYVSKKFESKSTQEIANDESNFFKSSDFQENRPEILSEKTEKDIPYSSNESLPGRIQTPGSAKTDTAESSSDITKTVKSRNNVEIQNFSPYSGRSSKEKRSYSRQNTQYDSRTYPIGYQHWVNPLSRHPSTPNPAQNQAYAHQDQYRLYYKYQKEPYAFGVKGPYTPKFSWYDHPEIRSHQWQVRPTYNITAARPITYVPHGRGILHNPMPPIRTNATRMVYASGSSYRNPMPFIKTNATPIRSVQRSRLYQRQSHPDKTNVTSKLHVEPSVSKFSGETDRLVDIVQEKADSSTEQAVTPLSRQSKQFAPEEIDNKNISHEIPKPKNLTKLENLAKSTHYSKRNMLYVDVPQKDLPASVFPLQKTAQGGTFLRPLLQTPIQYPPPTSSGCLIPTFSVGRRFIPPQPNTYLGAKTRIHSFSYSHPVAPIQAVQYTSIKPQSNVGNSINPANKAHQVTSERVQYRPTIPSLVAEPQYQGLNHPTSVYGAQANALTQSVPNASNSIQPSIQAQIERSQSVQYQPTIQSAVSVPQYQGLNHNMSVHGTQANTFIQSATNASNSIQPSIQAQNIISQSVQYQPASQGTIAEPQYQDPNHPICYYGTHKKPTTQNATKEIQHQDPNNPIYQYGTQYQPTTYNPNDPVYPYGTQTSLQTSYQQNIPFPKPMYSSAIPTQLESKNIVSTQPYATNPYSTNILQNLKLPDGSCNPNYTTTHDSSLFPNIYGMQTSVENPFAISAGPYSPGSYTADETPNQFTIHDTNQSWNPCQEYVTMNIPGVTDTIMYQKWSISTGSTPTDEKDEASADTNMCKERCVSAEETKKDIDEKDGTSTDTNKGKELSVSTIDTPIDEKGKTSKNQ